MGAQTHTNTHTYRERGRERGREGGREREGEGEGERGAEREGEGERGAILVLRSLVVVNCAAVSCFESCSYFVRCPHSPTQRN